MPPTSHIFWYAHPPTQEKESIDSIYFQNVAGPSALGKLTYKSFHNVFFVFKSGCGTTSLCHTGIAIYIMIFMSVKCPLHVLRHCCRTICGMAFQMHISVHSLAETPTPNTLVATVCK